MIGWRAASAGCRRPLRRDDAALFPNIRRVKIPRRIAGPDERQPVRTATRRPWSQVPQGSARILAARVVFDGSVALPPASLLLDHVIGSAATVQVFQQAGA